MLKIRKKKARRSAGTKKPDFASDQSNIQDAAEDGGKAVFNNKVRKIPDVPGEEEHPEKPDDPIDDPDSCRQPDDDSDIEKAKSLILRPVGKSMRASARDPRQVFYDFARDDEPGDGGNEGGGSRRTRLCHGLLGRIDDPEMVDSAFFQFAAHDFRERADRGFINICDLKFCRVQFVSGSHTADDRDAGFICVGDQLDFRGYGVDCVDDIVVRGEVELITGFRKVKAVVDGDGGLRIDIEDPVPHDFGLVLSDG